MSQRSNELINNEDEDSDYPKNYNIPIKTLEKVPLNEKLKSIDFPADKPNQQVVIYCNPSGYGYVKKPVKQNGQDVKYFDESLTAVKINQIITRLNKHIDIQLGKKKIIEAKDSNSKNIFILNILFVVGLVISLVMYVLALYDVQDFKEKYIVIPLIILLLIIIGGMIVMMNGLMKNREQFNLDEEIYKLIENEIKKEQDNLDNPGLYLSLPNDSDSRKRYNFYYLMILKKA